MASSSTDTNVTSQGAIEAQPDIQQAQPEPHATAHTVDTKMLDTLHKMLKLPQVDSAALRSLLATYSHQLALNPSRIDSPDLSELWELEKSLPGGENGFKILHTNIRSEINPNRKPATSGTMITRAPFTPLRSHSRVLQIKNRYKNKKIKHSLERSYPVEAIEELKRKNPRDALEELITGGMQKSDKRSKYLNVTKGYDPTIRENLGIPPVTLEAGKLLLSTKEHLPGIHAEYLYISFGYTITEFHREDGDLHSANILYEGFPKLWLFISPCSFVRFENLVRDLYGIERPACSQFVRHRNIIIAPSLLEEYDIKFTVIRQNVGDLVLVGSLAYHFVINEGENMAGAINYAPEHWVWPGFYRDCNTNEGCESCGVKEGCGNIDLPDSTRLTLTGRTRPLDFLNEDTEDDATADENAEPETQIPTINNKGKQKEKAAATDPKQRAATANPSTAASQPKQRNTVSRAATVDTETSRDKDTSKTKRARAQSVLADGKSIVVGSQITTIPKRARTQSSKKGTASLLPVRLPVADDELFLVIEDSESSVCEQRIAKLKAFGPEWLSFYERETTQRKDLDSKLIYDILAVVSVFGCPSVIQNVAQIFDRKNSFAENLSKPAQVYAVYKFFTTEQLRLEVQSRLLEVYITRFIDKSTRAVQENRGIAPANRPSTRTQQLTQQIAKIDANESSDDESELQDSQSTLIENYQSALSEVQKANSRSRVKSVSLVHDTVVQVLSGKTPDEPGWKEERERLKRAKARGREMIELCELLFGRHTSYGGAIMLPVGSVESPLDPDTSVTMHGIKALIGKEEDTVARELLVKATRELKAGVCKMAADVNKIYEMFVWVDAGRGKKQVEHAIKCMRSSDSQQYLTCFEWNK